MCELNLELILGLGEWGVRVEFLNSILKKGLTSDKGVIPLPGKQAASPMWQFSPIPVGSIFPSSCWEYTTLGLQRVYILSMLQIIC